MIANFTQNAEVEQYLRSFPPAQRQHCLELTMLLGVQAAKKRFPYGVTLEALSRAVEKQGQSDLLDPGAMLERLRKMKVEQPEDSHDTRPSKKTEVSDKRTNSKPSSTKPPAEPVLSRPKGDRKPSETRPHRTPTEERKERPTVSKKQEPMDRFMPVQPPSKLIYDEEDDLDTKETRIKPYNPKPAPQRPSKDASPISRTESKGKAAPPSTLVEPRTNLAYVGKLSPGLGQKSRPAAERNILKITDDFLADPFIALLSNQTSPKLAHGTERR